MEKNNSKKILNYAAISAAILGTADAAGQIVYTDIDDVVIDTADTFLGIDFNDDGIVDINVGLTNFVGGPGATANGSDGTSFNGNGIVGVPASGFYYPSNLSAGVTVDAGSPVITSERGDMYVYACYPNSQWCGEVVDGFLGAAFNVGGNTHYGWVRLDVLSNGAGGAGQMIFKDFAFDATPDAAIVTGDTGLGISDAAFEGFNYFVDANNVLNLSATTAMDSVTIHNVLGQQVINNSIDGTSATIDLSAQQSGLYLVTVSIEGAQRTVKVVR